MKITRVEIKAFRNIKDKQYDISKNSQLSIISGNNMQGKTNTLNAIMWCVCGVDLNGSNDNLLNIPYGEKEASVCVKFEEDYIIRKAELKDNKVTETLIVNGEEMILKNAEIMIDKILGIDNLTLKDTKGFKIRRFLFNPLYYRDVAPKELRDWIISVLFSDSEKDILDKTELSDKVKKNVLSGLVAHGSLANYSKVNAKSIKDTKASVETQKAIKDFLIVENDNRYNEKLDSKVKELQANLLSYSENKVAIDEFALELSKFYQKTCRDKNIDIVLLEKGQGEDIWFDVCYPKLFTAYLPIQCGSTAETIVVSTMFVNLIETLLELPKFPMLVDEGETLDKETLDKLCKSVDNQFFMSRVEFNKTNGVKLC